MPEIRQFDNRGKICRLPQAQGPGGGGRGGVRISLRPHKRREARRRWLSSGPIPILLPVTDLHQSVAHFPAGQGETAQFPAAFAAEDQAGVIVQLRRVQGTVLGITGGQELPHLLHQVGVPDGGVPSGERAEVCRKGMGLSSHGGEVLEPRQLLDPLGSSAGEKGQGKRTVLLGKDQTAVPLLLSEIEDCAVSWPAGNAEKGNRIRVKVHGIGGVPTAGKEGDQLCPGLWGGDEGRSAAVSAPLAALDSVGLPDGGEQVILGLNRGRLS